MRVVVDWEICVGCGLCVSACPEVFELEGGQAHAKGVADSEIDAVRYAIDSCPVGAISEVK